MADLPEKRKNRTERAKLLKKLGDMAFGKANDTVRLALSAGELSDEELKSMDLTMLSEIKRGSGGNVEIKLVNRLEAIRMLLDELGAREEGSGGAAQFFSAMSRAAGLPDKGAE
ncbi:MAG: hypothetical protein ACI3VB_05115 [Oscillospiraceae bacterium]